MYKYKSVWPSEYPPEQLEKEVLRGEETESNDGINLCSLNQLDTMGKILITAIVKIFVN